MSEEDTDILFRKILVAVDTSTHSRAALEAAVTLAKTAEATILGIFVQEEHWHRVSRLPSAQAVNELTGESQSLEEDALEQQVEMLKNRLRRQLKYLSQQNEINHSWKTVRGRVEEEIMEAAKEADLITIGRRGSSFYQRKKLGSTAKAIIRKADKPVLLLKKGLQLGNTVTTVYDTSEKSGKTLRLALALAEKNKSKLSILAVNSRNSGDNRDKTVEQMVNDATVPVKVTTLSQPDIGQFIHAVKRQQPGLLILSKSQSFMQQDSLESTLGYLHCPVLLIP